ncbi:hypothetical protein FXF51_05800 [Nonomuraea sp. PA05]|uniref:hypothetical protein n=1 Tax=Nonomuraea sp. PA05 TaxID=2604466 RepID=UPI0011D86EF5|nr:hypothetical protein [Nonomuraea sp. PA05]TYB69674.1 hypothetical protein FXF51_05800 [Nonomuraea sp. PA05]
MRPDLTPDAAQARMDDLALDRFYRWLDRIAPHPGCWEKAAADASAPPELSELVRMMRDYTDVGTRASTKEEETRA